MIRFSLFKFIVKEKKKKIFEETKIRKYFNSACIPMVAAVYLKKLYG